MRLVRPSATRSRPYRYAALGNVVLADGSTVVTANTSYTLAQIQGMQFQTTANANGGGATFIFNVQDSGGTLNGGVDTITKSITVTVTAVNDAPTLGNGTLAAVAEDTASPAGQAVSTIFTGQFADIDAGASFGGIAVVGNTANAGTQGSWQYSTNGGSNWFAIGTVADNATALAINTSTLIRFVPVADYNGTPPALVVRGLDNTYVAGFSTTAGSEAASPSTRPPMAAHRHRRGHGQPVDHHYGRGRHAVGDQRHDQRGHPDDQRPGDLAERRRRRRGHVLQNHRHH